MAIFVDYSVAKGEGDLTSEELQYLDEVVKQAIRELEQTEESEA